MIGIGKWSFAVNTVFLKGTAQIEIKDNNGKYAFSAEIPGLDKIPEYHIDSVEENGSSLKIEGGTELLPGKKISVFVTFDGDACSGYINAPFLGKIMIENGKKVG